ncbi:uncharacterized protein [Nicotiana tomentosiformis]|uniref:uncharacterized protein n=1 Tax=Nicotiana tomentosiformis TaxID=4098 RepID=UPI000878A436|nr:uncharacterized protein LOC104116734 [Nicotiana tomentosiformis]
MEYQILAIRFQTVWIHNRLPTDDNIKKLGYLYPSRYDRCDNPMSEDVEHIFRKSNLSKNIWNAFRNQFGINDSRGGIRHAMLGWWFANFQNPIQKLMLQVIIPLLINWHIWKARCRKKYDQERFYIPKVAHYIFHDTTIIIHKQFRQIDVASNWKKCLSICETAKPKLNIIRATWKLPQPGMFKLNTNGCSNGNPCKSGGGGVVRVHQGEVIAAFATPFGIQTNNAAESLALCIGLKWCKDQRINKICVELDSSLVVNWVNGKIKPPWNLRHNIEEIQKIMITFEAFHVTHCYREANRVADALAKEGSERTSTKWYFSAHELPSQARGLCFMDKDKLASFRIRASKTTFVYDAND